jgi:hypothetical protein
VITKIISGGQTGADRAALDWAIEHGIPHGGRCPKGRLAEDGEIPKRYHLQEMRSKDYLKRTEQNIIDSDGTAVFSMKPKLTGGSKRTAEFAVKHQKPLLHIHPQIIKPGVQLVEFITQHEIKSLNVAGPRASGEAQIGEFVKKVMDEEFPQ